jgi:hypothetical protein
MRDFMPDPYADPAAIAAQGFVDDAYLAEIAGIAFESAATEDQTAFTLKIRKIVFHGLDTAALGR